MAQAQAKARSEAKSAKPDYGLDAPYIVKRMVSRGLWTLVVGLAVFFVNRSQYPGTAGALFGVLGAIAGIFFLIAGIHVWSSRVGKLQVRGQGRLASCIRCAMSTRSWHANDDFQLLTTNAPCCSR
jgi:hypothetical protein